MLQKKNTLDNQSMDPRNFNFSLQTGFNQVRHRPTLSEDQRKTLERLMMVFIKKAVEHAVAYVKAAKRTIMLTKDIELGLKVAAMPTATYSFWTQDLHTELEAVEQLLLEEESDEEEESELVEEVEEEWTAADSSHSDIVKRMNEVDELWEAWQPTDTMGIAIKRSIDERVSL